MSFSALALARSVPNGFSMMTRDRSTSSASASMLDDGAVRRRRDAEVMQPPDVVAADLLLRLGHRLGQRLRGRPARDEGQPLLEVGPLQQRDLARGVLVAGMAGQVPEVLVAQLAGRAPDDPVIGHQPGDGEVEQARQELARRQVTRRPEQHDHVRLQLGRGASPSPPSRCGRLTSVMAAASARSARTRCRP